MKLNVPNTLTSIRIILIPVFLWQYLGAQTPADFRMAAFILAVSALTDTIDGWIARRFNMITQLGKILDPIADKLTLAAVVAALWVVRPEWWLIYSLFIAKEVVMVLGGLFLHRRRVIIGGAKWFGKLATVMFYVIMITIVAFPEMTDSRIFKMLVILLLFMIFAFLQYAVLFRQLIKHNK